MDIWTTRKMASCTRGDFRADSDCALCTGAQNANEAVRASTVGTSASTLGGSKASVKVIRAITPSRYGLPRPDGDRLERLGSRCSHPGLVCASVDPPSSIIALCPRCFGQPLPKDFIALDMPHGAGFLKRSWLTESHPRGRRNETRLSVSYKIQSRWFKSGARNHRNRLAPPSSWASSHYRSRRIWSQRPPTHLNA
jgi:hypothetical protein